MLPNVRNYYGKYLITVYETIRMKTIKKKTLPAANTHFFQPLPSMAKRKPNIGKRQIPKINLFTH